MLGGVCPPRHFPGAVRPRLMQEAWIQLQCSDCATEWEANPSDLPAPETSITCDDCGESGRIAEFAKTKRDLEVLKEFHGE